MSSFIGHAATGLAIYLCQRRKGEPVSPHALLACVGLATLPDLDYLPQWLFGLSMEPRLTHTLLFALCSAGLGYGLLRRWLLAGRQPAFPFLLLAAASHPVLDLLVGVHAVPLFWPLAGGEVTFPLGLLPSAGHLDIGNYYLWRNLLIECGVLWPVLTLAVALCQRVPLRHHGLLVIFLAAVWLAFLCWSLRVHH